MLGSIRESGQRDKEREAMWLWKVRNDVDVDVDVSSTVAEHFAPLSHVNVMEDRRWKPY